RAAGPQPTRGSRPRRGRRRWLGGIHGDSGSGWSWSSLLGGPAANLGHSGLWRLGATDDPADFASGTLGTTPGEHGTLKGRRSRAAHSPDSPAFLAPCGSVPSMRISARCSIPVMITVTLTWTAMAGVPAAGMEPLQEESSGPRFRPEVG